MVGADLQGLLWGGAGRAEPELVLCPTCSLKMQPTATMATEATTTATVALTTSWDNATSRPTVGGDSWKWGWGGIERSPPDTSHPVHLTPSLQAEPDPILDNYVLLVVVMSLFIGGTLVVLSGVLLLCKRCWEVHQRFNR